jgi:hypothetical protein
MISNWRFLTKTTVSFCKKLITTLVFEKKRHFFAENWQKSQKIVITTSIPGNWQIRALLKV